MALSRTDYWRAVVLYGANTTTDKIALATCLIDFATLGTTQVPMPDLAAAFFHAYRERLAQGGRPQIANTQHRTVLERAVGDYSAGSLTEAAAVDRVARQGFGDVLPRFHTVNGAPIPIRFYEATGSGLVLTDDLLATFGPGAADPLLRAEVAGRWDLLEAAFAMHLPVEVLGTDENTIYRTRGSERVDITGVVPVLSGYQNGVCFYCREPFGAEPVHVDHCIPRAFLQHDEIWNLVLAHASCNLAKSDLLPPRAALECLYLRNEHYIASNHPIKRHLIQQMGATPSQRRAFLVRVYMNAEPRLVHIWAGMLVAGEGDARVRVLGLVSG